MSRGDMTRGEWSRHLHSTRSASVRFYLVWKSVFVTGLSRVTGRVNNPFYPPPGKILICK